MATIGKWEFPDELAYTPEHVWVRIEGEVATVGLSAFGTELSGQIVFVEAPRVGRAVTAGEPFMSMESGKWVGRIKSPVAGTIAAANEELEWGERHGQRRPLRQGLAGEDHPRGTRRPLRAAETRHACLRGAHRCRTAEVREIAGRP